MFIALLIVAASAETFPPPVAWWRTKGHRRTAGGGHGRSGRAGLRRLRARKRAAAQAARILLTGDVHSAEDLLQSAYAKVLPRWRRVSTYHDPDAYLRKVMVNQRTSWWRRAC